ncbi:hypothetical protein [Paenibacillus durus]|uniref:Uncharacterized protein n=1 Tax=Paenibacillus durus ATCC 35681 TaxID=1333534 RepID=A0A0F7CI70_PAEDU|nr:hypothetical protein [Paenibacillus durus]AKG34340.1 hypothetical protein VK70_06945 [Paenibacillus durus ATCC 35681]
MNPSSRRKRAIPAMRVCFLLILILILTAAVSRFAFGPPAADAPAANSLRLTEIAAAEAAGSSDSALSPLPKRQDLAVPDSLKAFVREAIDKLADEAPFKEWKTAKRSIHPLGPGTHGWLVNLISGDKRIGYMIITASDNGGYTLSEYGADTEGLPYSVTELRLFLAQKGLIHSLFEIIEPVPLYAPLLPYWKVTVNGQVLYVNAIVPEILPWDDSKAEAVARSAQAAGRYGLTASGSLSEITAAPMFLTGHPGNPYDNLLWLTSPKLAPLAAGEFVQLLEQQPGLVFRSNTGANDILGAPLMITGYQLWTRSAADGGGTVPYAASGIGGRRFVPLGALQASGTFQAYVSGDGEAAH